MIRIGDYPQLSLVAWQLSKEAVIDETTALGLYERNWAMVDQAAMGEQERALLERLIREHGNGCFAAL